MALPNIKNLAYGTLASSVTTSGTTLSLTTGHGARFPASGNFYAVLMQATYGNAAKAFQAGAAEIVLVTAGHGTDSFTVTRAQQSTTGVAFSAGDHIFQAWTTTDLNLLMPNEMTTRGDLIRRGASAPERVALGAIGKAFFSDGTDAVWDGVSGGDIIHADHTDVERWVCPGVTGVTARTPTANRLHGLPFFVNAPCNVTGIHFNVTTGGAGSTGRVGIYKSKSKSNIYPGDLVVDGGEKDTSSTGVKSSTINVNLDGNRWYWLAYLASATAPGVSGVSAFAGNVGVDTTFAMGNVVYVSQTYGALPSTFPTSATWSTTATICAPAIKVGSML